MITCKDRTTITQKRKNRDSSSSKNWEELDYTISPKTIIFSRYNLNSYLKTIPRRHATPYHTIDRPLTLYDELKKLYILPVTKGQNK